MAGSFGPPSSMAEHGDMEGSWRRARPSRFGPPAQPQTGPSGMAQDTGRIPSVKEYNGKPVAQLDREEIKQMVSDPDVEINGATAAKLLIGWLAQGLGPARHRGPGPKVERAMRP